MAALQNLNFEQAMTLVFVVSMMCIASLLMAGRIACGFEGGRDDH